MNPTYKTALKALMIILLICGGVIIFWWMAFELPSKQEVDEFLKYNCCNLTAVDTDYPTEYYCAYYLRRHTTLLFGKIYKVPKYTFLFVKTPFHYFNYFEPEVYQTRNVSNIHCYVFVMTKDHDCLVYNPVNGKYVGRFDDLLYPNLSPQKSSFNTSDLAIQNTTRRKHKNA